MNHDIRHESSEIHHAASNPQPEEQLLPSAPEHILPASEHVPLQDEFNKEPSSETHLKKRRNKKRDHANRERKLLTRMSGYGVACFFSVVILATSLQNTQIQDNVIAAGGSVDGDMRFSIQWNDEEENQNDFDAHSLEPGGYELFYGNRGSLSPSGGDLDVDIIEPQDTVAIENIVYKSKGDMEEGTYTLSVQCYNNVGYDGGFRAQIELNGRIYNFKYDEPMDTGETVVVAVVTLKNGRFQIDPKLERTFGW